MDQIVNQVDENELQKAINNITSTDNGVEGVEAALNSAVGGDAVGASMETPETITSSAVASGVEHQEVNAMGVPEENNVLNEAAVVPESGMGLADVKASALSDLRPILDRVELPAEHKFRIYKEIVTSNNDSAAIEPAYNAAKSIVDEKERAEALLFIVETIDRLDGTAN